MEATGSTTRRWLAGICLAISLVMMALGLTVLAPHLGRSVLYLIYWFICICLTLLAAFVALVDLLLLRRELRRDQKRLIEQTLRDAETDRKKKENS